MKRTTRSAPGQIPRAVLATLAIGAGLSPSAAQERGPTESFLRQQRALDQQIRQELRSAAPLDAFVDWEWGGWVDYYVFHFDDGVQSSRVYQRPGTSFWSRLSLDDGAHQFFARVRLNYNYFNPGDEFDRQQDWVGPNFDRAWYEIDAARAFHLDSAAYNVRARIGRQEVAFGTGYALDLPMDAVVVETRLKDFRLTGLVARTIASTPNIDRSPVVDSHSNRLFLGAQAAYDGWQNHQPFIYALWNNDRTDERPQDYFQEYDYDTAYFGAGSRGSIVHNLNYWAEAVWESGRSYGDGMFLRRDSVRAWGWDVGLEYRWDSPRRPRVALEYMFASGDKDRLFNATGAQGGNRFDGVDHGFAGFGYRDTGISAAPALSNLHIWRAGASFTPLPESEFLRDLELGTNWFLYHKHQAAGAISDTTADMFRGFVGWEMDYFVNWRLASDIAWTMRWGLFFPGDAFSDRDTRQFLMTGITWSY